MSVVFVAGASGYTGREVARLCVERGVTTHAHVRPDSPSLERLRARFGEALDTTPWDHEAMTARLTELAPTHVFALLGTTKKRAKAAAERGVRADYEAVDVGLTLILLDAAKASGSKPRFIYLSALGTSARTKNAYLSARHKVEEQVRASGLPYVIARPSLITGPDREDDRPLERLTAPVLDGALGLMGALGLGHVRDRYRSTTSVRLATALVSLAFDPHARGVFESDALQRAAR